eukprot:m.235602 g.235602  ORF g.235602 m.235602 type:complete len:561 (+) comp26534_c2_seq11:539-2221(+)
MHRLLTLLLILAGCLPAPVAARCTSKACWEKEMVNWMKIKQDAMDECVERNLCPMTAGVTGYVPCINGKAGQYDCKNVDHLANIPVADLNAGPELNDMWGWKDPNTGMEVALVGTRVGTTFVDVTNGVAPVVLGWLPTHTENSIWRDVKVYQNHAFIVSEASGHGMQVFDLTKLRNVKSPPKRFQEDAHFDYFGAAHNIIINEESGFAYASGASKCNGGLIMIDIQDPLNPTFVGCFGQDGYVHDAQCVNYNGPDSGYKNREICFCYNGNTLTIVDVTNKNSPQQLSRTKYPGSSFTHQGWLTADSRYVVMGDEEDEQSNPYTKTFLWDVQSLKTPIFLGVYKSPMKARDHNLYITNNKIYQTNYCAGLRILRSDESDIQSTQLTELGYFDMTTTCGDISYLGAWSSYPYFDNKIVVSSINTGLFILRFTEDTPPVASTEKPAVTSTSKAPGATCTSLGWGNGRSPCASNKINGNCLEKATFDKARKLCQSIGADLCTTATLKGAQLKNTEKCPRKKHNKQYFWVLDTCNAGHKRYRFKGGRTKCYSNSRKGRVACCLPE